jgi:hypothetical protein
VLQYAPRVTGILVVLGSLMVLVAMRDVFDTLFHPHGQGVVSDTLMRAVWRATRRLVRGNHDVLSLAGPIAFIGVIVVWGSLVVLGFALIIWPYLPDSFATDPGLDPAKQDSFIDALYLSMVNLASLGYGDIVPTSDLLRLLGPLETLIGLGLLTASISWILLLYRVLSDYRSLSHEIALLTEVERSGASRLDEIEPAVAAGVLADLTSRVIPMRDDLVHSPIAYYFRPRDPRHALPVLLPRLLEIVKTCSAPDRPTALRFQAAMLDQALEDLLSTIADEFVRKPARDTSEALADYRRDHLWASG